MKQTCPECKSIIEIDEKKYQSEENVVINCPLCGTTVIFSIPKLEVPKPEIVEKIVEKKVESAENQKRIDELEQEIRKIKESQGLNNNSNVHPYTTKDHNLYTQTNSNERNKIRFIFSFNGRIGRTEFIISLIIYYIIWFGCEWGELWSFLILSFAHWMILAQGAKRCHDLGHSGWYQIIPFYILWMIFEAGDIDINDYDDDE